MSFGDCDVCDVEFSELEVEVGISRVSHNEEVGEVGDHPCEALLGAKCTEEGVEAVLSIYRSEHFGFVVFGDFDVCDINFSELEVEVGVRCVPHDEEVEEAGDHPCEAL